MPVSSSNVYDRTEQPVVDQANQKNPITRKETVIERGHPLSAHSGRASSEILEWLQECSEKLVDDEVPEHGGPHVSSSHEVSLWRPHPRDVRIWVSTASILISVKTEISRSVRGPKLQGPRAGDEWRGVPRAKNKMVT